MKIDQEESFSALMDAITVKGENLYFLEKKLGFNLKKFTFF